MNYAGETIKFTGVLAEVTDGAATVDLEGRLGKITVPKRMIISEKDLAEGQKVKLEMSYIQVVADEQDHVSNLKNY